MEKLSFEKSVQVAIDVTQMLDLFRRNLKPVDASSAVTELRIEDPLIELCLNP